MLKYLWRNKLLILLLILIIVFCPTTIGLPEQGRTDCIVTAVGVDKKGEEFEVTLQYIVPQSNGGQQNLKTSKQKGKSVGEVFEKLSLELGKSLGFSHCRFIVFNDEASDDNLTKIFDYLLRQKTNTNNIVLISTKESASDLLGTASGIDSDLYTFLSNSGFSNELKEYNDLTTIGDFYRSYFGPTKSLCVYVVETKTPNTGGSSSEGASGGGATSSKSGGSSSGSSSKSTSSSSGGSSSSSGSSSSGGEQKQISNEERIAIIKGKKRLLTLSNEESQNLIWFNKNIKRIKFEVKDYQDAKKGKVDTLVNVTNRLVSKKVYFDENFVPHYKLSVKSYVRASQLVSENLSNEDYEISQNRFDDNFINALKKEVLTKLRKSEENFKTNNYDVIDCFDLFYKYKNKELKEYLKTHLQDDFIKNVVFEYDLSFIQGS